MKEARQLLCRQDHETTFDFHNPAQHDDDEDALLDLERRPEPVSEAMDDKKCRAAPHFTNKRRHHDVDKELEASPSRKKSNNSDNTSWPLEPGLGASPIE
jgi:hypothetical protein